MTSLGIFTGNLPPSAVRTGLGSEARPVVAVVAWKAWICAALLVCAAATVATAAASSAQPPAHEAEASTEHGAESGGLMPTVAKLFNFAVLAGVLVYFLRTPIAVYLASRSTQIREDLVTAAGMRAAAVSQLAEIQRRLQSLPAELEALTRQGAEDLRAEQARIAETARTERDRLLDQTRREIAMRLRIARRQITEHAAQLTISVAEQHIRRSITPDDHLRLVERYTAQLKEAR